MNQIRFVCGVDPAISCSRECARMQLLPFGTCAHISIRGYPSSVCVFIYVCVSVFEAQCFGCDCLISWSWIYVCVLTLKEVLDYECEYIGQDLSIRHDMCVHVHVHVCLLWAGPFDCRIVVEWLCVFLVTSLPDLFRWVFAQAAALAGFKSHDTLEVVCFK